MVCRTPTLKTATNSKETRGNAITHPHSYLLTPGCFQSVTVNREEGSTATHLHLLQLSFQLLQVMAGSDKETTTTFSSLQLTRSSRGNRSWGSPTWLLWQAEIGLRVKGDEASQLLEWEEKSEYKKFSDPLGLNILVCRVSWGLQNGFVLQDVMLTYM